jgi:hypothetical protein
MVHPANAQFLDLSLQGSSHPPFSLHSRGVFCIMGLSMKERLRVWRDGWEEKDNLGLEH